MAKVAGVDQVIYGFAYEKGGISAASQGACRSEQSVGCVHFDSFRSIAKGQTHGQQHVDRWNWFGYLAVLFFAPWV